MWESGRESAGASCVNGFLAFFDYVGQRLSEIPSMSLRFKGTRLDAAVILTSGPFCVFIKPEHCNTNRRNKRGGKKAVGAAGTSSVLL